MKLVVENTVREHRTDRKLTQAELGDAVGVSRQSIISIERGQYIPSLPLALRLAEYFGIRVDDLFFLGKGSER